MYIVRNVKKHVSLMHLYYYRSVYSMSIQCCSYGNRERMYNLLNQILMIPRPCKKPRNVQSSEYPSIIVNGSITFACSGMLINTNVLQIWFSLNSYIPVLSEDFTLHDRTRGNESKSETNLYSLDDNAIDNRHKMLRIMPKWKQNFFSE